MAKKGKYKEEFTKLHSLDKLTSIWHREVFSNKSFLFLKYSTFYSYVYLTKTVRWEVVVDVFTAETNVQITCSSSSTNVICAN